MNEFEKSPIIELAPIVSAERKERKTLRRSAIVLIGSLTLTAGLTKAMDSETDGAKLTIVTIDSLPEVVDTTILETTTSIATDTTLSIDTTTTNPDTTIPTETTDVSIVDPTTTTIPTETTDVSIVDPTTTTEQPLTLPDGNYYWTNGNEVYAHIDDNQQSGQRIIWAVPCVPTPFNNYYPEFDIQPGTYNDNFQENNCQDVPVLGGVFRILESDPVGQNISNVLKIQQPWTTDMNALQVYYTTDCSYFNTYNCTFYDMQRSSNFTNLLS